MSIRKTVSTLTVAILVGVVTVSWAQEQPSTTEQPAKTLQVTIQEDSGAGGLNVSNSLLPGNILSYLSCEGVLFGEPTTATPLFEVKISPDPNAPGPHWTVADDTFSYTWNYDEGIKVDFEGTIKDIGASSGLQLRYTLTNTSQATLKRVLLHTCIPTTDAPAFFPGRTTSASPGSFREGRYMGFYDRTYLWSKGQSFNLAKTEMGTDEIHLSFMREGSSPLKWEWWVNGPETFDYPFIAIESKDGKYTTALGFEAAEWASCNAGDERACYHLFPLFGDLEPGESKTVEGCFYMMPGTSEDALRQFKEDYPTAQ